MEFVASINIWFWILCLLSVLGWVAVSSWVIRKKRSWKIIPIQFALLSMVLILTFSLSDSSAERELNRMQELTSYLSSLYALEVREDGHQDVVLSGDPEKLHSLNQLSSNWMKTLGQVEGAITVKRNPDSSIAGVTGQYRFQDSIVGITKGAGIPFSATPLQKVWQGKQVFFLSSVEGPKQYVVSAAPIRNSVGKIEAAACILLSAEIWQHALETAEQGTTLMGLFLCFLVLCGGLVVVESNHSLQESRMSKAELTLQKEQIQQQVQAVSIANQLMAESRNKLEMANQKLHALATLDGLTGVMNHRTLMEFLSDNLKRNSIIGSPCSVILLDIDNFKQLNDQFGHMAGDEALRVIAYVMKSCTPQGCGVGRYGGEEFMVILPGYTESTSLGVAEEIRRQIQLAPMTSRTCTASVGVSTVYSMNKSEQTLIDEADRAMYHAKKTGKNKVIHFGHGLIGETA